MLTRQQQLESCKICLNRQMDMQKGMVCKLTGDIASFEDSCKDFDKDEVEAGYQEEQQAAAQEEKPIEIINRLDEGTLNRLRQTQDMQFAILGGLGAALVSAMLWAFISVVTNYQMGIMAIAVGLITGLGVRFFGSGVDKVYGIIGALFAVLGCSLGNLFTQVWFVADYNALGMLTAFKMLDWELLISIYEETFSPIDIAFYGIAIAEGYNFAFRKISPTELSNLKRSPEIIPYPVYHKARMPLVIVTFILLSTVFFSLKGGVNGLQTYYYEDGAKQSEGALKDGSEHGPWIYYYEDETIALTANYEMGLETGKWEWYEDGAKIREGHYAAGVPHGTWINYYPSGTVADSGYYQNGRMTGAWVFKYDNGQVLRKGSFIRDQPEGEWKSYHQNGQLMSLENYSNGKLTGQSKFWYDNGQVQQEVKYEGDKIKILSTWDRSGRAMVENGNGKFEAFFENGALSQSGKISAGKKVGIWKWFYDNGGLQMEGKFDEEDILVIDKFWDESGDPLVVNGQGRIPHLTLPNGNYEVGDLANGYRSGLWHTYSSDGSLLAESNYLNGKFNGPYKAYFLTGLINIEGAYEENKEVGVWKWYYENGQMESSVKFIKGQKEGIQTFYNEVGTKVREEIYKNGKLQD